MINKLIHTFKYNKQHENAGWPSHEMSLISMAYSCLQAKSLGFSINLVTDPFGRHICNDVLNLPYNKIETLFPETNDFCNDQFFLFPIFKIQAYAAQHEPFIHIDNDVFLFNRNVFPDSSPSLITQNQELDLAFYANGLEEINNSFHYIPKLFKGANGTEMKAFNAGVIGGTDIDFFKRFEKEALHFAEQNAAHFAAAEHNNFLPILEQLLFSAMAQEESKAVHTIFEAKVADVKYLSLSQLENAPEKAHYIHPVSSNKNIPAFCETLIKKFKSAYPEYYHRIIAYCRKNDKRLLFPVTEYEAGLIDESRFGDKIKDMAQKLPRMNLLYKTLVNPGGDPDLDKLFRNPSRKRLGSGKLLRFADILRTELKVADFTREMDFSDFGQDIAKEEKGFSTISKYWQNGYSHDLSLQLTLNPRAKVIENRWCWNGTHQGWDPMDNFNQDPEYFRSVVLVNIYQGTIEDFNLEPLDMVILEVFEEEQIIESSLEAIKAYFDEEQDEDALADFRELCLERIKHWTFKKVLIPNEKIRKEINLP
ncbi:MAG: DUF6734 family protein [Bacteroidota bacterium]